MRTPPPRRGRPPLTWLDGPTAAALPTGTALNVQLTGANSSRLRGRIASHVDTELALDTTRGEATVTIDSIRRARVVSALYEPGDPVLRRHVPAATWRGGVVRTEGTEVLVEQIDGTFAWFSESELESPEARDPALPALRRGPVPTVQGA